MKDKGWAIVFYLTSGLLMAFFMFYVRWCLFLFAYHCWIVNLWYCNVDLGVINLYTHWCSLGAFEDPDIIHVDDTVDPVRDLEVITEELRLKVWLIRNFLFIINSGFCAPTIIIVWWNTNFLLFGCKAHGRLMGLSWLTSWRDGYLCSIDSFFSSWMSCLYVCVL